MIVFSIDRCSPQARRILMGAWVLLALSCVPEEKPAPAAPKAIAGTQIAMDFSRKSGFYSAPFPSEDLRGSGDEIRLDGFPNPKKVSFVRKLLAVLKDDARGFSTMGGIYFQLSAALDPKALPSLHDSASLSSKILLMGVDEGSPDYLVPVPITTLFEADGGPFGAENQLSLLPLQGRILYPKTTYVAVVLRSLGDASGEPLGVSLSMAQMAAGVRPEAYPAAAWESAKKALKALKKAGIKAADVAGMTVFRTEDPTAGLKQVVEALQGQPLPALQAPKKKEEFDDYCVYEGSLSMPVYQEGTPPFTSSGGGWVFDAQGKPVKQRDEKARVVFTVPRGKMPAGGWPVVLFVRTGGGGDRPLVDRGVRAKAGGPATTPGSGPALAFAKAGWAGVSVDGPHGGLRNVTKGDEQFLIFNITNPIAMRDNIRQSALELTLMARMLDAIQFAAKDCPAHEAPGDAVRFNAEKLVLMGHSMGATIGPLAAAMEPRIKAMILSGAGGSWIENIVHKRKPIHVRPLAETILVYGEIKRSLHSHDPALTLLQWAGEPADPPVYSRLLTHAPLPKHPVRHVLMLQGIIDSYIMPPIANTLSLSLGLDLAGDSLDASHPKLKEFRPLDAVLGLVQRKKLEFPTQDNRAIQGKKATLVVVQHLQGPVEDGHEVVFQTEGPKHQYRCFLESFARGSPSVPKAGKSMDAPCK